MSMQGNPRFSPTAFKGRGRLNAIPVHVREMVITGKGYIGALPSGMTLAPFGYAVSINPAQPNTLLLGMPTGAIPVGVLLAEEAKMQQDVAMPTGYFTGEAATYITWGMLQYSKWAMGVAGLDGPALQSKLVFNTTTGEAGFIDFDDAVPSGFTETTARVIKVGDGNVCTVFLGNTSFVENMGSQVTTTVATPVFTPAGGAAVASAVAVAPGTQVTITSTTPNVDIYYTMDGTVPNSNSDEFDPNSPLVITGAVNIQAIAIKAGMTNSAVLSQFYKLA